MIFEEENTLQFVQNNDTVNFGSLHTPRMTTTFDSWWNVFPALFL